MWTWKDLDFYFDVDYLLRTQIVIYLIKGHLLQIASIHCPYHERLIVFWTRLLLFFIIMKEIKKNLYKRTYTSKNQLLKTFSFYNVGHVPTSVHKLICSLFMYIWHYWTFPTFKDEKYQCVGKCTWDKAVAYGYLFSCSFALGLL